MKKVLYIVFLAAVLLPSCKKNTWVDWRLENQLWIENISNQPGVITTPTGLRYKIVSQPKTTDKRPDDLKYVAVKYSGTLITGNVFDSKDSTSLAVSDMVSGFAEGLRKMTPQARYILYIPSDLAYGADGTGTEGGMGYIPPYSTLIFDVTLYSIQ